MDANEGKGLSALEVSINTINGEQQQQDEEESWSL